MNQELSSAIPSTGALPVGSTARLGRSWGCSSAGRAPRSHRGGQGFESPHLHHLPRLRPGRPPATRSSARRDRPRRPRDRPRNQRIDSARFTRPGAHTTAARAGPRTTPSNARSATPSNRAPDSLWASSHHSKPGMSVRSQRTRLAATRSMVAARSIWQTMAPARDDDRVALRAAPRGSVGQVVSPRVCKTLVFDCGGSIPPRPTKASASASSPNHASSSTRSSAAWTAWECFRSQVRCAR
jgi:hypothetical protein